MEFRTPRKTVRDRGYLADTKALCHPKMLFIILMIVLIGHLLAPGELDFQILGLGMVGVIFLVLASYRINELHDGTTTTCIPNSHQIGFAIGFFVAAIGIGIWMAILVAWWILLLAGIGIVLTILYNLDIHPLIHNRPTYGIIWGGLPLVFSEMLQASDPVPTYSALFFGAWASIIAVMTLWLWGPMTCGRMAVCKRANGKPIDRLCHSPVLKCKDRLEMPKEIHNHMKVLIQLNLFAILVLTIGIYLLEI